MTNRFYNFINLHHGEENKQKVLENVTSNVSFRGSNLWILACAILIASIGLNVNSTAVIIGAMLISPLMGPIVGAGFSLGTYDFKLLRRSIKNLAIATVVGLIVSGIYFYITPYKEVQSELLARTSPNIYDVLIAFFGGLVGVIATTRVEKGNPIPGVAIATALMPPLCTAGYGIAMLNWQYFLGALYLYAINCFFIFLATYLIVKYLKYPISEDYVKHNPKLLRNIISLLLVIMIVPSGYFAYSLVKQTQFQQTIDKFINNELAAKGYVVIYKKTHFNRNPKSVELAFLNKQISSGEVSTLNYVLNTIYALPNTTIILKQDTINIKNDILNEIKNSDELNTNKKMIAQMQKELETYKLNLLASEAKMLLPQLQSVKIKKNEAITDSLNKEIIFSYQSSINLSKDDIGKLRSLLKEIFPADSMLIIKDSLLKSE